MEKLPAGATREGGQETPKIPIPIPVPVKVDLPANSTWTSEATHLELSTYFDPQKPNISRDFGLDGLQPIIRDTESDIFLLQDASRNFYQWSSWDGDMWHLVDLKDIQEAAYAIMRDSGILRKTQVWNLDRLEERI
ncbi:hypothetical protein N7517_010845 [Penicillium concentricum]|uniref:Uncharacterized protein n=1 Tax=Penicillium concentricum TaxID=293559 RepID=A0A9W9R9V6_9EURO|nr:uncharacterized protein N7517_010845 [Penicillium concentricum]KAJ5356236.1 hypothetical protein N7517_010845 [Penicillium concentricum]